MAGPRDAERAAVLKSPVPLADTDSASAASDNGGAGAESEAAQPSLAGIAPGLPLMPEDEAGKSAFEPFATLPAATLKPRTESDKLNALALTKLSAKEYPAAVDALRRVLNFNLDSPAAHGNLALALWRSKCEPQAEVHCRRAIALNAKYIPAYRMLAELLRLRNAPDAIACYRRLLALDPDNFMAHNNVGLLLGKLGRRSEADAAFKRALDLKPGNPEIRFNQLMTRRQEFELAEAIECCRQSLKERPSSPDVLTNLAVVLQQAGRHEEALAEYERAISIDPDHLGARFNLSLLLLLRADFARGWREYEHRWHLLEVNKPKFAQPEWQGENLDGKTILLHSEQGFGDSIQCLRYVHQVAARGGRVVLRLERPLVRLAASLPGHIVITPTNARPPAFDVWCPLLSLPRILGTRPDSIPSAVPYLGARPVIVERWQRRLAILPGLKIGLVWGGSPQHVNDFRRSIELQRLKPLLEIVGVSWVSLQVGPRTADLAALPVGTMTDLSAELSDFAETAGAILNLDLVIAVDTAVAHLAGALASPAWIMLPFSPDWRWLLERGDSPWYRTLRLYRQKTPGDWDDVVARLTTDLAERVAAHARDAAQHA
ncbi:Tetratricopeptide (TPR) repeat [Rhizobiales bacterium GAS191]|nr:Tetratricopeptide (TPR) repeat [Rhizobiales bacterium GAS113]SEC96899.1 Tetratricopeptide (TPR) repeat [Rhizobiales bacterium GAS191]